MSAINLCPCRLSGEFDRDAFERAIATLIERHEVLRTCFVEGQSAEGEDQAYQVVRSSFELPLAFYDLSDLGETEQEQEIQNLARREIDTPFDLSSDLLLRVKLLKLDEHSHVVLSNMHHIASDGWSMGVFFRELSALYNAYHRALENPLPALPVQYADYAFWQRSWLQGEVLDRQLEYWKEQLSDYPPVHALPMDHARPAIQSFHGRVHRHRLDVQTSRALQKLCRVRAVTLFIALQTAFAVCLGRYSNESDIVIGTPIAGRTHGDIEGLIGFFVNTLALRTRFDSDDSFVDLLAANKQTVLDAFTHQHIPFEMLVEQIQPERSRQHSPLFQILFALQNNDSGAPSLDDLELSPVAGEHGIIKFDLELFAGEHDGQLILNWNYNTDLFEAESIERLAASYEQLLKGIVADPDQAIGELPILPAGAHEQLLEWNDTSTPLPECAAHVLFEQQAEQRPDAIALVFNECSFSYARVNRRANQLARYLQQQGVGPESRVGVSLRRSEALVVSLLAIWKAGGAYVPLDPAYPRERLEFMIGDAGLELVIGGGTDELSVPVVELEAIEASLDDLAPDNLSVEILPANLAYVMYTSGSTGRPKGVMINHGSIVRLLFGVDYMQLDAGIRFLQAAPVTFDLSTLEVWAPLLHGGCCVLLDGEVPEARQVASAIRDHKADSAWLTSALFNSLVDESAESLIGFRQLAVGGEAVSAVHVRRLYALDPDVQLINGYGPTECTTFACCYPIPRDHTDLSGVPIGPAIGNTEAYVLDANLQAVPVGVVGELYLGGCGLARGYLDRPSLTAERFVPSPYRAGECLYRTGDLCRYRSDGAIEYMGRVDHQVKVRGFRIELGEVESRLLDAPGVQEAAALVLEGELGKQLVAYVVSEGESSEEQLKRALQSSLPSYMVPLAIVELEAMPLTANGKLNRAGLPEPDWDRYRREYVAPRNDREQQLVDLFQSLLPVERIGIDDNFFELGGHSLLATRLISRIREEMNIELPLRLLFDNATPRLLSETISSSDDEMIMPSIGKAVAKSLDEPLEGEVF